MPERLLIVGGDAAGMSAASQARRLRDDLEVVAFERGSTTSYSACGIPYWVSGMVEPERLVVRTPGQFRERGIDARVGHEVVEIDTAAGRVVVRDRATGRTVTEGYDQLLVATGAAPIRPDLPGIEASGIFGIQSLDDGRALLEAIDDRAPGVVAVVGAGYIGIEMAEALLRRGHEVHVIDRSPEPMGTLDPELGARLADAMRDLGIRLHLRTATTGFGVGDDGWVRSVHTSEGELASGLVVLGIGTQPDSDLAAAAGVPVGPTGGIVTDRRQRTRVDGVWAAGDCAETFHRVSGAPVAIALGTIANKQGRVAGINLGGRYAAFPGVLGTAVTKLCGLEVARTGLGEAEAERAGLWPVTATIESTTRAGYYPGTKPLVVRMIAERGGGRLLGAQIVGEEGAAKRIDVLATAVWTGMTVDELSQVDLSYAPPFSPVWDPVLIAARRAAAAVSEAG